LLVGTSRAIGEHRRDRCVGASVAPEFTPKRNSELIGNRGRSVDDAVRPAIGDNQVRGLREGRVRFVSAVLVVRWGRHSTLPLGLRVCG
jgi:hypothetical protein